MGKYLLTKNDTSGIIGVIATITQIDHLHPFLVPHRGCHFFRQVHHLSLSQVSFDQCCQLFYGYSISRKIRQIDILSAIQTLCEIHFWHF